MRPFAKPVVLVVLFVAACSPTATTSTTASPSTMVSPTTTVSSSTIFSLTAPPMWIATRPWTTFFSDRYQFRMGYPSDWTVVPADHDWTLAEDADNWLSTGQEVFLSPTQDVRLSVWEVDRGTTGDLEEQHHAIEAWVVKEYCPHTNDPSCTGLQDRAVNLCIETHDCHPGLLVPFENDVQAFLRGGDIGVDLRVVSVWRPEAHLSVAPYGGAERLLEAFLYPMGVCPRLDQAPRGCPPAMLKITSSDLGDILVSGAGHTLYLFAPDNQGEPTCDDLGCADSWRPLVGTALAGEGVRDSLRGVTVRTDGTLQATYKGWPLYLHNSDLFPGDHNGQGQDGQWWVIDPSGNPVGM